ncbi:MAG: GMP/IMP nucleotidase [Gammaproteobacteria bacterium]|nr:MAG: GMP/IMP nucleotidase [Gammaproteobacteria bacterium]
MAKCPPCPKGERAVSQPCPPDWSAIDQVFLDMDGTLLDLHFDNHFWLEYLPRHYAERHGMDEQQAREELYRRFAAVEGTLDWYCLDYWRRELGVDIVALKHEIRHLIRVHERVIELLDALRARGKRLVLLTNAHRDSLNLKIRETGLDGHFDRVISSHDLGLAKEHPQFWPRLQSVEPFDPARSLLVDDNLSVLQTARAAGIAHLVAVRHPDSQRPERQAEGFCSVRGVGELLDSLPQ